MSFGAEHFFLLLLLLPIVAVFLIIVNKRRTVLSQRFIEAGLYSQLVTGARRSRRLIIGICLLLTLLFIILALTQPRWGQKVEQVQRRGVEIYIAVDVSNSMKATDVYPNRLEKSKLEIKNLLRKMQGDRVGLIAFAGSAFVVSPLTVDFGVFEFLLDDLDAGSISAGGTDIESVITTAVNGFEESKNIEKVLIIFTDGEKQWGDPVAAAQTAAEQGIRIYTVGIGTPSGAQISVPDKASGGVKTVTTKLNVDILKKIAAAGNGDYVINQGPVVDIDRIYLDNINKLEKAEIDAGSKETAIERFQIPLILALVLLTLACVLKD